MIHRITLTIIAALFITGCVSYPEFYGRSLADKTLRRDVYKNTSQMFQIQYNCRKIDSVNTEIGEITKSESGVITLAIEFWRVRGCNEEAAYTIKLIPDANGETDFLVINGSSAKKTSN